VNRVLLGSLVSESWKAWCRSSSFSLVTSARESSSRPFSSETLTWFASVSRSFRSCSSNVLTSPNLLATSMMPIVASSRTSGAITASRTSRSAR
jgi:hypothetical protein